MDVTSADWIGLTIKYKGKCSICNKEISTGDYALWSRSRKSIKHPECDDMKKDPLHFTNKKTNFECYICKNTFDDVNNNKDFEVNINSDTVLICGECINSEDSYLEYQKSFLDSLNKTKVKKMR